jgi:hypothetical protein
MKLTPIADQSVFVRGAVSGVIREAVIAGALTGVMILRLDPGADLSLSQLQYVRNQCHFLSQLRAGDSEEVERV